MLDDLSIPGNNTVSLNTHHTYTHHTYNSHPGNEQQRPYDINTIISKQEAPTMFFTKRSKKDYGSGEEAAPPALKNGGNSNRNKRMNAGGSRVLQSWRPGSTNSSMVIGRNSNRSIGQNSLKSRPIVLPDVELQPTDTGDSNELVEVVPAPAITGPIADQLHDLQLGGDRDSLAAQPFQDHDDDDDDQDEDEDGVSIPREEQEHEKQQVVFQTSVDPKPKSTLTKPQVRQPDKCDIGRSKSPFVPPEEINIDFHPQPLSPIRDPTMPQQRASFREPSPSHDLLPEDIVSMKRQLLDSQRLVRLILGKPLSCASNRDEIDSSLLDTNTVLQAIKAFALMKQELGELRKRQEQDDNDPPAILQTLSSPTTTSGGGGGLTFSTPSSRLTTIQAESTGKEVNDDGDDDLHARGSPFDDANPTIQPSNSVIALWDANKRIESLKAELETARNKIQFLQDGEKQESKQQQQQQKQEKVVSPSTDQDKEITLLRSLLRQSQKEAGDLRQKLNRISSSSLSDSLSAMKEDEEDAENEKPKLDVDGHTILVSGKQGPAYVEEKKVDM